MYSWPDSSNLGQLSCQYQTDRTPDFYLHETADWLVFPHELNGLSVEEILENKPGIRAISHKLEQLKAAADPP
jgi:hypothetical protein